MHRGRFTDRPLCRLRNSAHQRRSRDLRRKGESPRNRNYLTFTQIPELRTHQPLEPRVLQTSHLNALGLGAALLCMYTVTDVDQEGKTEHHPRLCPR